MKQRAFLTALVCLALVAGPELAFAKGKHTTVHPTGGTPGTPVSLQDILNSLVVSGPALDANTPENIDNWNNSAGPMTAQIVVDQTLKSEKVKFGLFDSGDPNTMAFLLSDSGHNSFRSTDVATVTFNDDGSIGVHGGIHKGSKNGFDGPFGFFIKDSVSHTSPVFLFTQANLNPGGATAVKVFQGNDSTMLKLPGKRQGVFLNSQFLVAFETGSDHGFEDIVFLVSGILPGTGTVPEPTTLALLAISTLGVAFARRGRNA
jgi:hypothetical protein